MNKGKRFLEFEEAFRFFTFLIQIDSCSKKSKRKKRVVSASGSETCVTSSMPTSAIIYDACTSIKKNKKKTLQRFLSIGTSDTSMIYFKSFHFLVKVKSNEFKTEILILLQSLFANRFETITNVIIHYFFPSCFMKRNWGSCVIADIIT